MKRRGFLRGLLGLFAAPVVVNKFQLPPGAVEAGDTLLKGEPGVAEGLTFHEEPIVIDQLRGVAERELNPFQEAWARWMAEEMDKAMFAALTGRPEGPASRQGSRCPPPRRTEPTSQIG